MCIVGWVEVGEGVVDWVCVVGKLCEVGVVSVGDF